MAASTDTYHCTLPEATSQYAVDNLREDVSRRNADIQYIRDWINTQPKLHARTDPVMIMRFLRGCKFDYEKTKRKITNFYMLRAKAPEWFTERDPILPELTELMELGVFLPLRKRDAEGRLIVLIRAAVHNPSCHLQANVFKVGKMILDLALEEDESISIYGLAAVFDLQGVTLGHALQLPPHVIKKAVHAWQDCYPVRTKRLDFVNAPVYVNVILNIFRQFMTEKLRHRTHVHFRKLSSLHSVVSPELLPVEYGGSDGTLRELIDYWLKKTRDRRQWYLDDSKYKAEL